MATFLILSSLLLLLLAAAASAAGEEDFAFETSPGEDDAQASSPSTSSSGHVRRHWGIPDVMVVTGKLLHVKVPADAFSGAVDHYEAEGSPDKPLPPWLLFDKTSGLFEGVPGAGDVGENYVIVKAVGAGTHNAAKDVFSVEVLRDGHAEDSVVVELPEIGNLYNKEGCEQGEDLTFLTVLLDAKFEHLKPKQRVAAIKNLAGFLSLHHSLFHLEPHSAKEDLLSDQIVLAGPGNVKKRSSKHTTAVRWQVGCEGRLWKQHADFVHQLRQQARDGTLAEVVQQPIVGWHVKTEASAAHRERRETGSGDYDDEDTIPISLYGNADNVEETDTVPEARIVPTMASPVFPEATTHPHRHHHGEELPDGDLESSLAPTSTLAFHLPISPTHTFPIMHTPTIVPVRPTRLMSLDAIQPSRVYDIEAAPSATPVFITEVEPSVTPEYGSTQVTDPLPISNVTGANDTILSSTGSSTSQSSPPEDEETVTTPPLPRATTEKMSPAARPTDETTEYGVKNFPPLINKRLGKFPLTAGKVFRYHIPENTFTDLEEGNTRNLRLIFKTPEGTSLNYSFWAQFNLETQEVYALPLDENVSKWKFILEALDKEGKSVSDYLELSVQHHKSRRAVNHEFSLHLHVDKSYYYPSVVDWELEVLDALVKLYGDSDASQITVRSVNVTEPVTFTWTNDTLPKTHCPKDDIDRLYKVLVADDNGKPSTQLKYLLGPRLRVTKVTYQGIGQCSKPTKPEVAAPPVRKPQENFSPTPRNQVDHIKARVGELLVFVVPEDSFYDPEDGSVRNLKLSLMMMDRSPIPPNHWLQFDVKNQEFYGVPLPGEEGREEYQLVCEDKEGLKAHDSLVVEVSPARKVPYSVEFSMTVDTPYDRFRNSAHTKRHFVEKVMDLFGDRNVTTVTVAGVQADGEDEGDGARTTVTWHNQSLAVSSCPRIDALRRVLMDDDESISERVNRVLGSEFAVTHIRLVPVGVCLGSFTVIHSSDAGGGVDETPVGAGADLGDDDDYLVTFVVPAVVIVAMLVLAGVVACVLYRRRRRGKMSVGDEDDERQSFRNKGIPVIFQDELEERPEPDNKSPVIMKDEKPPLPPPEYQRDDLEGDVNAATPCLAPQQQQAPMPPSAAHPLLDDAPYQPPPPFTSSRESARQNRPKPTPTYRKPPPYVPP